MPIDLDSPAAQTPIEELSAIIKQVTKNISQDQRPFSSEEYGSDSGEEYNTKKNKGTVEILLEKVKKGDDINDNSLLELIFNLGHQNFIKRSSLKKYRTTDSRLIERMFDVLYEKVKHEDTHFILCGFVKYMKTTCESSDRSIEGLKIGIERCKEIIELLDKNPNLIIYCYQFQSRAFESITNEEYKEEKGRIEAEIINFYTSIIDHKDSSEKDKEQATLTKLSLIEKLENLTDSYKIAQISNTYQALIWKKKLTEDVVQGILNAYNSIINNPNSSEEDKKYATSEKQHVVGNWGSAKIFSDLLSKIKTLDDFDKAKKSKTKTEKDDLLGIIKGAIYSEPSKNRLINKDNSYYDPKAFPENMVFSVLILKTILNSGSINRKTKKLAKELLKNTKVIITNNSQGFFQAITSNITTNKELSLVADFVLSLPKDLKQNLGIKNSSNKLIRNPSKEKIEEHFKGQIIKEFNEKIDALLGEQGEAKKNFSPAEIEELDRLMEKVSNPDNICFSSTRTDELTIIRGEILSTKALLSKASSARSSVSEGEPEGAQEEDEECEEGAQEDEVEAPNHNEILNIILRIATGLKEDECTDEDLEREATEDELRFLEETENWVKDRTHGWIDKNSQNPIATELQLKRKKINAKQLRKDVAENVVTREVKEVWTNVDITSRTFTTIEIGKIDKYITSLENLKKSGGKIYDNTEGALSLIYLWEVSYASNRQRKDEYGLLPNQKEVSKTFDALLGVVQHQKAREKLLTRIIDNETSEKDKRDTTNNSNKVIGLYKELKDLMNIRSCKPVELIGMLMRECQSLATIAYTLENQEERNKILKIIYQKHHDEIFPFLLENYQSINDDDDSLVKRLHMQYYAFSVIKEDKESTYQDKEILTNQNLQKLHKMVGNPFGNKSKIYYKALNQELIIPMNINFYQHFDENSLDVENLLKRAVRDNQIETFRLICRFQTEGYSRLLKPDGTIKSDYEIGLEYDLLPIIEEFSQSRLEIRNNRKINNSVKRQLETNAIATILYFYEKAEELVGEEELSDEKDGNNNKFTRLMKSKKLNEAEKYALKRLRMGADFKKIEQGSINEDLIKIQEFKAWELPVKKTFLSFVSEGLSSKNKKRGFNQLSLEEDPEAIIPKRSLPIFGLKRRKTDKSSGVTSCKDKKVPSTSILRYQKTLNLGDINPDELNKMNKFLGKSKKFITEDTIKTKKIGVDGEGSEYVDDGYGDGKGKNFKPEAVSNSKIFNKIEDIGKNLNGLAHNYPKENRFTNSAFLNPLFYFGKGIVATKDSPRLSNDGQSWIFTIEQVADGSPAGTLGLIKGDKISVSGIGSDDNNEGKAKAYVELRNGDGFVVVKSDKVLNNIRHKVNNVLLDNTSETLKLYDFSKNKAFATEKLTREENALDPHNPSGKARV